MLTEDDRWKLYARDRERESQMADTNNKRPVWTEDNLWLTILCCFGIGIVSIVGASISLVQVSAPATTALEHCAKNAEARGSSFCMELARNKKD
jgi:hypothetical protein